MLLRTKPRACLSTARDGHDVSAAHPGILVEAVGMFMWLVMGRNSCFRVAKLSLKSC
jgi:hypothetical protein